MNFPRISVNIYKLAATCPTRSSVVNGDYLEVKICHLTQFAVYDVTMETTTTGNSENESENNNSSDDGISSGAVAGIVIGVILAVLLLAIIIKIVYNRASKSRYYTRENHIELQPPESDEE